MQLELFTDPEEKEEKVEDKGNLEVKKSILDEMTEEEIQELFGKSPDDFRKGQL